jgi:hypothetical protein
MVAGNMQSGGPTTMQEGLTDDLGALPHAAFQFSTLRSQNAIRHTL